MPPVHKNPSTPLTPAQKKWTNGVEHYAVVLEKLPGTYQGNQTKYKGQKWSQLYINLAYLPQYKYKVDPGQLASAVVDIYGAQKVGGVVGSAFIGSGNAAGAIQKGAENFKSPIKVPSAPSWLTNWGGWIGSGIEAGLVSFFTDLYNVIVGPLEIVLGVIVAIWVLAFIFKDDLAALAPIFLK